jgi:hypothetical protein
MFGSPVPRALLAALSGIISLVLVLLVAALFAAEGKNQYELLKDLFVPLIGPVVAVLIPLVVLYVIPNGQSRERFALDLCGQYYSEEMRISRNVSWQHFVVTQRNLPPVRRAEALNHFLDYLTNPETHRGIEPAMDEVYQKASRILDFFALVNECVGRGTADRDIVRSFLLYYYLWWRDEILDPLRKTRRIVTDHPKFRPLWWTPMIYLDQLVGSAVEERPLSAG